MNLFSNRSLTWLALILYAAMVVVMVTIMASLTGLALVAGVWLDIFIVVAATVGGYYIALMYVYRPSLQIMLVAGLCSGILIVAINVYVVVLKRYNLFVANQYLLVAFIVFPVLSGFLLGLRPKKSKKNVL